MFYEIIQKLINSNAIINPIKINAFTFWNLVYTNELTKNAYQEENMMNYYFYLFISNVYYIPSDLPNYKSLSHEPFIFPQCSIHNLYFQQLLQFPQRLNKKKISKRAYIQLDIIMNNSFISKKIKNKMMEIWVKTIKTQNAFIKLFQLYKYKKSKLQINTDLCLNPIDPNDKNAIMIYHDGSKYLFILSDLINHIETAICNCNWWFAEPLKCKNPYNNLPFSKSILYNIYFRIKASSYLMPILIHNYFLCDFNLKIFSLENEYLIRDTYIKKYVTSSSSITLLPDIYDLLYFQNFDIEDDDYSKEKDEFVEIMRPYLYLYFVSKHSVYGTIKRMISKRLLNYKLNELYLYNPKFGTKIMKRVEKGFVKSINIDHIKFTMNDIIQYYKNPNKYDEIINENSNEMNSNEMNSNEIINPTILTRFSLYNENNETIRQNIERLTNVIGENTNDNDELPRPPITIRPINQTYSNNRNRLNNLTHLLSNISRTNNEILYQFTIDIDGNDQQLGRELSRILTRRIDRELEEGEINENEEELEEGEINENEGELEEDTT